MKKILLFLICVLAVITASAELTFSVGQMSYSVVSDGEVQCNGFTSAALAQNPTTANIPGRVAYNGTEYKVKRVGDIAFKYCSSLKYVYVDWGITEIGQQAFNSCSALSYVRLPSTVTAILENAFADCTSMSVFAIAAATPPTTTTTTFSRMKKCDVHVATTTARYKFNTSYVWKDIDTDGSVACTPTLAFDFSASGRFYVIHTGRDVNSNSAKATLIGVNTSVTFIPITNVTDDMPVTYGGCSSGYSANVTKIADEACKGNTKITSVGRRDLGTTTGFEEVGESAFDGCTALTLVAIPCGSIRQYAFRGCTALSDVQLYSTYDMDKGVSTLYSGAFKNCTNLHEIMVTSNRNDVHVGGDFENTASDFKCYVPLRVYYNTCHDKQSSDQQKMHPFIKPENEWTRISCYRPVQLPSNAEFYIVENITKSGNYYIANKKRVTGSVAACTGMMMKATPGTIYRLNVASSGTTYINNKLKGVEGDYAPETYTSDLYTYSADYRYFRRWTTGYVFSGGSYMSYNGANESEIIYFDGTYAPYNLRINNYQVTSENYNDLTVLDGVSGEQVSFNPSTRVLTLKNATIGGTSLNSISTADEGLTINVIGTNTINDIYLGGDFNDKSTITGGGTLNMLRRLSSGHDLTIKGGTKLAVTLSSSSTFDYAIDNPAHTDRYFAYLTIEGSGTELRISTPNHPLRSTLNLNDGLYIAKPTGASFKAFNWSDEGGVLVDAYGNELNNTEVLISSAAARGFKHRGLWYEDNGNSYVTLIEPQRGENYSGDVVIPDAFSYNGVKVVNKIDSCAFTGTLVTSVEVPEGVTSIGGKAFYGAKTLKKLVLNSDKLPNKYTLLGDKFVGNNASEFACYVKNSILLSWMQSYNSSFTLLPWVKTPNDNGYTTFSCVRNVTLPEGLTAYSVSGFNTSKRMATTTKLTNSRIHSNSGVILQGEPATRYLLSSASSASNISNNMLRPFLKADQIPYAPFASSPDDTKAYFLAHIGSDTKEWREFQNNIDLFMALNAGIAYLAVDKTLLGDDYTSPVQLDLWSTAYPVGDVDGDYKVDVSDVNAAINIILELKDPNEYPGNADITGGDNKVDISDVNEIINIILSI